MTPINIATDIPTNINTLEKLAAWVGLALTRCNPGLKYLENPDQFAQRVADTAVIKADDNTFRQIVRLALPIEDDYATSTKKSWEDIKEISQVQLPSAFKSN